MWRISMLYTVATVWLNECTTTRNGCTGGQTYRTVVQVRANTVYSRCITEPLETVKQTHTLLHSKGLKEQRAREHFKTQKKKREIRLFNFLCHIKPLFTLFLHNSDTQMTNKAEKKMLSSVLCRC